MCAASLGRHRETGKWPSKGLVGPTVQTCLQFLGSISELVWTQKADCAWDWNYPLSSGNEGIRLSNPREQTKTASSWSDVVLGFLFSVCSVLLLLCVSSDPWGHKPQAFKFCFQCHLSHCYKPAQIRYCNHCRSRRLCVLRQRHHSLAVWTPTQRICTAVSPGQPDTCLFQMAISGHVSESKEHKISL